jgi:hypothetical protein
MQTRYLLALLPSLIFPATSFGQNSPTGDLSTELTVGIFFIDSGNNLSPNGSKPYLSSLDDAPKRELTVIPALVPELTYRFGDDKRFAWYLNSRSPMDEAGSFALSTGMNSKLPTIATFDFGLFYVPFAEVWKNPYLVNEGREETDVFTWGGQFTAGRIFDSPLELQIAALSEDVEDDDLAKLFPQLGRDGEIYHISTSYGFFTKSAFPLTPKLSFRKGEYDGDSSSFSKVKAEISGRYLAGRLFLMPTVFYSYKEYDEKDPIFDATREENGFGINLIAKYNGLFNSENLGLMALTGYSRGEANEDFYSTESLICGLGLSYRF